METLSNFVRAYLEYLTSHPEKIDAIILWTITCGIITIVEFIHKREAIDGSKGKDTFWEIPEYITYMFTWLALNAIAFVIFFQVESMIMYAWWIMGGIIVYAVGGRWIFQWALAFISRKDKVVDDTPPPAVEQQININPPQQ